MRRHGFDASGDDAVKFHSIMDLPAVWVSIVLRLLCLPYLLGEVQRPNIVLILTDDQDLVLGGLNPMVKTWSFLANEGTVFTNAFVTTPLCCPSRSSILTGKYLHNHMTVNNSVNGGCSNLFWQQKQEKNTFAVHLKSAGYRTFYAGKYLNQYGKKITGGPKHVPDGWDWWVGLVGNSRYYNYTLSINGSAHYHSTDYLTDVIKNNALSFLQHQRKEEKFLMVLSPPAPHAPFTPAPKYVDYFKNVTALHTPNFNMKVQKDKHWLLRMKPSPLPEELMPELDHIYRSRWETLLSVDDMVESIIKQLEARGILNNTYIIYTSDHGYHIGQFGLPWDKRQPYEFDIRIPLLIRGPNVPKKTLVSQPVLNIDLSPTILAIAGLSPPKEMDGQSFLHVFGSPERNVGRTFLVEYRGEGNHASIDPACSLPVDNTLAQCSSTFSCKCLDSKNNTYMCVRHLTTKDNFLFCTFHDSEEFIEAYNLQEDPYQLHNIRYFLDADTITFYQRLLIHLSQCTGITCDLI